jgi:hypothetical protein
VTHPGPGLTAARFAERADVYPHMIMGRILPALALDLQDDRGRTHRVDLRTGPNPTHVFEDIAPRLVDADGDGQTDVVVVETDPAQGAQLAIYSLRQGRVVKAHATPHIGQPFRWLAPVAVADLDGDGITDIALVDRPHLARELVVWTFAPGGLTVKARLPGVTNHRIGDEFIAGGLRDCGSGPELVLADARWSRVLAVAFRDGALVARDAGRLDAPAAFDAALSCAR